MSIEDDIHDKLTQAYMQYFKANEKFESLLHSKGGKE